MKEKFLFCGLGSIGTRHLNNLVKIKPKAKILAYRTKAKKRPPTAKKIKIREFFELSSALAQKPKAVFITNPTSLHLKTAIQAAKQNCHLFIEKPLSAETSGVKELIDLVKQKKLVAFVGYVLRFHPQIKKIKEILEKKILGKVYMVQAIFSHYLADWHAWEGYQQIYSAQQKLGGGILLDASHEIDYLYWFLGKVNWLQGWVGKQSSLKIDVEDTVLATLKFASGLVAQLQLDYLGQPPNRRLLIIGKKGSLAWDFFAGKLSLYNSKNQKWSHSIIRNFDYNHMYLDELKHFLACLEKKEKPAVSLQDSFYTLKLIEAIRKSSKEGKRLKLCQKWLF